MSYLHGFFAITYIAPLEVATLHGYPIDRLLEEVESVRDCLGHHMGHIHPKHTLTSYVVC